MIAMNIKEARDLLDNRKLWPRVRDYLAKGGELLDFSVPENRMQLLDQATLRQIHLWQEALSHAAEWKTVVNGAKVRELKAAYPGIYPDVFRFLPYFSKFDLNDPENPALVQLLLKIRFPEAYELCYS